MAYDIIVPPTYAVPLNADRYVRNGKRPHYAFGLSVAKRLNHTLVFRRKCLYTYARSFATARATTSSTVRPWRFYFRTGRANASSLEVRAVILMATSDGATTDSPSVQLELTPTGGGGALTATAYYSRKEASAAILPDKTARVKVVVTGVAENTTYSGAIVTDDKSWPLAITVYERHATGLLRTDTWTCDEGAYFDGADITYQADDRLRDVNNGLWLRNGSVLLAGSVDLETEYLSTTSATYVNAFDTGVSAVDANSLGYRVQARYHDSQASTNIPTVWAVYGVNATADAGKAALVSSGGTAVEVTLPTSIGWVTTTANLAIGDTDAQKYDLHIHSNGVATTQIQAWGLYEDK